MRTFRGLAILMVLISLNTIILALSSKGYAQAALSSPFHPTDDGLGPTIQNISFTPENLTTITEFVLVKASIADSDGISWARIYACLADENGFQMLCLPAQEMILNGEVWEVEVEIPFVTIPGDHIGFNITAQDNFGSTNTYYTIKTVEEASTTESKADDNAESTQDVDFGIWGPFLGLTALAIGKVQIRSKKKAD